MARLGDDVEIPVRLCADARRTENNETRKVKMFCSQAVTSQQNCGPVARLRSVSNERRAMIYFRLEHQRLILQIALRLISAAKIIICLQYIIMRVVWFSVDTRAPTNERNSKRTVNK